MASQIALCHVEFLLVDSAFECHPYTPRKDTPLILRRGDESGFFNTNQRFNARGFDCVDIVYYIWF